MKTAHSNLVVEGKEKKKTRKLTTSYTERDRQTETEIEQREEK